MATKLKNLKIKKSGLRGQRREPWREYCSVQEQACGRETPAVQPKEDTPPEESILKRIVHAIAKSIGATDAQAAAAVEEVSKNADVPTFGDAMARRRMRQTTEEIWDYCYALNDSLCGIVANADITAEDKKGPHGPELRRVRSGDRSGNPEMVRRHSREVGKGSPRASDTRQNRERQSSPRPL